MIRCVIELVEMHLHVDGPLAVMDKLNANWIARLLISLIRNNIAATHWEIEIIVAFAFQSLIAVDCLLVEREEEDYTNNNNKCDAFSCASISRKMSTLDFDSINPVPVIINFYGPLQIAWMRNVCLSLITRSATHQHHSLLCQSVGLIFFCLLLPAFGSDFGHVYHFRKLF